MHVLQSKHSKLNEKDAEELLEKLNISKSQLPKILLNDPALPENCKIGEVIKREKIFPDGKTGVYYRVIV